MHPRIGSFFNEFLFLEKHIDQREIIDVKVERLDEDVLFLRPSISENRIYFFDKEGKYITEAGGRLTRFCMVFKFIINFGFRDIHYGGSVVSVIEKNWRVNLVYYVVDHNFSRRKVVIYKTPKGFSSAWEWLNHRHAVAKTQMAIDIVAIDSVR